MKTNDSYSVEMNDWELFEEEACIYLNKTFSHTPVTFYREGGKDSSASDIKVYENYNNNYILSIESKLSPSQSGQFVLYEENEEYILSPKSVFENNKYTQKIIKFLNENKDIYSPKGQEGIDIKLDKKLLAKWIINHYIRKDSFFVITSNKLDSFKAIIPIKCIGKYFDVSAVIRRKKSGTHYVSKLNLESCIKDLKNHLKKFDIKISKINNLGNKTLVKFDKEIYLKRQEKYFGDRFYLSYSSKDKGYYLKRRSVTNNLNVIFSLDYIGPEENIGVDLLEEFLINFIKNNQ